MEETKKKKLMDIAGVALVAALVGVGVWMAMDGGEEEKKSEAQEEKLGAEAVGEPVAAEPVEPAVQTAGVDAKPMKRPLRPRPAFMDEKPRSEWDSREKAIAYQWYAKDPANQIEGIDMLSRVPPPVFSNLVQEALAPYLEAGADVVPAGPVKDEEAWVAINTPIEIFDTDNDEIVERKQGVQAMLGELREFMEAGGHARDYFLKLEARQALEVETRNEVYEQVRRLEREGDVEGAAAALEMFNEYLEGKGLPKVHMRLRNRKPADADGEKL